MIFEREFLSKIIRSNIRPENYYALSTKEDRIGYLRALAIGNLINEAAAIFMKHEDAILKGNFHTALLDKSQYEAQINDIIKISIQNVYQSTEVVDKEIAGYRVINTLLDTYTRALNSSFNNIAAHYDKLILKDWSPNLKLETSTLYQRLSSVCFHIASLSDSQAIKAYKKIQGFEL